MARFTIPRDIYFGRGSLDTLKTIHGNKAVVVIGGGSVKSSGALDQTVGYLKEAGIETEIFEGIEPDPSVATVEKGAAFMSEFAPDWVIPLGGGSVIDAAKMMWAFYENPEATKDELFTPFGIPELRQKAHFIAIPTTSGTGSEATFASVLTDYDAGVKFGVVDFGIVPDIAIIDPNVADSMPSSIAANTGMDALTHAIESYVSTGQTPFTAPLSIQATKLIIEYLPASVKGDSDAREQVHYAQCMAGMAFTNAMLGVSHAIAHATGVIFETLRIPHGAANAIYLPYVIQYNAKEPAAKVRYADIAQALGLSGTTDDERVAALVTKIKELNATLGIPASLRDFGFKEEEFHKKVGVISENAVKDNCVFTNPRSVDDTIMMRIIRCIYEGKDIDF
jgi:alcohol dehydrogenase class IV